MTRAILDDPEKRNKLLSLIREQGLTISEAGGAIGISAESVRRYRRNHEDFAEELRAARGAGVRPFMQIARDMIFDESAKYADRLAALKWVVPTIDPEVLKIDEESLETDDEAKSRFDSIIDAIRGKNGTN